MSDVMLLGVLRMPRSLREADLLSQRQFDCMVDEAASELEKRADRIEELEAETSRLTELLEMTRKSMDLREAGFEKAISQQARALEIAMQELKNVSHRAHGIALGRIEKARDGQ